MSAAAAARAHCDGDSPSPWRGVARSVIFATPRHGEGESPSQWARAAAAADTAVLYMAAGDAEAVRKSLLEEGLHPDTPVAIIENASLPGQNVFPGRLAELPQLASQRSGGPALLVIGEVLRELTENRGQSPISIRKEFRVA